jgi:hypothetical protein
MKTIIFTNARDEDHILEWIAHHLNLGFTTVYVFDHKSNLPIADCLVDKNTDDSTYPRNKVIVERIDEDMELMKNKLQNKALEYSKKHSYDWLLYLDADEFLYFKDANTVDDFLSLYANYNQITISWLLFGSNHLSKKPKGTILESYTKSYKDFNHQNVPKSICKPFVKPSEAKRYHNAHFVNMVNKDLAIHSTFQALPSPRPWLFFPDVTIDNISAFIAHHVFQSYETYIGRKVNLPTDNHNIFRPKESEKFIHSMFNDVDTYLVRDKYNERNKQILKLIGKPEYLSSLFKE